MGFMLGLLVAAGLGMALASSAVSAGGEVVDFSFYQAGHPTRAHHAGSHSGRAHSRDASLELQVAERVLKRCECSDGRCFGA